MQYTVLSILKGISGEPSKNEIFSPIHIFIHRNAISRLHK